MYARLGAGIDSGPYSCRVEGSNSLSINQRQVVNANLVGGSGNANEGQWSHASSCAMILQHACMIAGSDKGIADVTIGMVPM